MDKYRIEGLCVSESKNYCYAVSITASIPDDEDEGILPFIIKKQGIFHGIIYCEDGTVFGIIKDSTVVVLDITDSY